MGTQQFRRLNIVLGLIVSITLSSFTYAETALPDMDLMLEIVVNGKPTNRVEPVQYHDGHYYLAASVLHELGLPVVDAKNANVQQNVVVDQLEQIHVNYDSEVQQLLINVPNDWLPEQHYFIDDGSREAMQAHSHYGFLMNYDAYINQTGTKGHSRQFSLYSEQRFFSPLGILSNQGIYQYRSGKKSDNDNRYLRYDTNWRYNDDERMLKYTLGDLMTNTLSWTNAVRLGGFQIKRSFLTQPNLITYPLPEFSGQATVPSAVDLYVNGYKTSQVNVDPGPFTINTAPYINGVGEATIVVTDALGRQVSTSVPFYVANNLLKKGLVDFSFSAGALRRSYAQKSFDYDEFAANGSVRYGLTNWLTLESHVDGTDNLLTSGVGGNLKLGWFGLVNSSYSESRAKTDVLIESVDAAFLNDNSVENRGYQKSFGYSYIHPRFSVNTQRTTRSVDYASLANYKSYYRLSKQTDQVTASVGFGRFGVIGTGYFDIRQHDDERLRLANVSYSVSPWRNIHFYTSLNREIGRQGYSGQLIVNIPLDTSSNVSFSTNRNSLRDWLYTSSYSQSIPFDGGLGWDLGYSDGDQRKDAYKQASVTMRTSHLQGQAGVYGGRGYTYWGGLSGSVVFMNKQLYASNIIHDSFALVSTDGYSDIPVLFENQQIGLTNKRGYILIPSVSSYYPASYQIDPLALPADLQLPDVQQRVMIKEGSGYVVEFSLAKLSAVNTRLLDKQGVPLPIGSAVRLNNSQTVTYVGWNGQVYLEHVKNNNALVVIRTDDRRECRAAFALQKVEGVQSIAALTCVGDNDIEDKSVGE